MHMCATQCEIMQRNGWRHLALEIAYLLTQYSILQQQNGVLEKHCRNLSRLRMNQNHKWPSTVFGKIFSDLYCLPSAEPCRIGTFEH